ncbi:hypothetical protein [Moraxella marmotae]|uniref:hypothetical protein n=1 Tax=Moraxella marmotae TaxID=3344520 RepID=UPI0035F3F687
MKKSLLAIGLCLPVLACADVYLGSYQGYEYYLIASKTKAVTGTSKYEVEMERYVAKDIKKDGLGQGSYTVYRRYIDCAYKKVATISWHNYTKNHKLIDGEKVKHLKEYDIFPNSWGAALYNEICR